MMKLVCIDPGTTTSGLVELSGTNVVGAYSGIPNDVILTYLRADCWANHLMLVEMVACYGMPVGKETFETCVWIGRFIQAFNGKYEYVYRRDVKLVLCNSMRAKDANVRQAILNLYPAIGGGKTPQVGTKKEPGPLYNVKSHAWSALAIGLTWIQTNMEQK